MEEGLNASAQECGLNMEELAAVLQPIIESCTKDAISAGKNYIFSHSISDKHADVSILNCWRFWAECCGDREEGAVLDARISDLYITV